MLVLRACADCIAEDDKEAKEQSAKFELCRLEPPLALQPALGEKLTASVQHRWRRGDWMYLSDRQGGRQDRWRLDTQDVPGAALDEVSTDLASMTLLAFRAKYAGRATRI
jgi:hypothetical protein